MMRADARFIGASLLVGPAASSLSDFRVFLATGAIIAAMIARSVGILYSDTRMVSLCQVSFTGIGGWTVGWLALNTELPLEAALLLGGIAAVPVGVVVGLPALRLRGVDLAVVTLEFAAAIQVALFNRGYPGTRTNFAVPRPGLATSEVRFLWFTLVVAIALEMVLRIVRRRTVGTTWALVVTRGSGVAVGVVGGLVGPFEGFGSGVVVVDVVEDGCGEVAGVGELGGVEELAGED